MGVLGLLCQQSRVDLGLLIKSTVLCAAARRLCAR